MANTLHFNEDKAAAIAFFQGVSDTTMARAGCISEGHMGFPKMMAAVAAYARNGYAKDTKTATSCINLIIGGVVCGNLQTRKGNRCPITGKNYYEVSIVTNYPRGGKTLMAEYRRRYPTALLVARIAPHNTASLNLALSECDIVLSNAISKAFDNYFVKGWLPPQLAILKDRIRGIDASEFADIERLAMWDKMAMWGAQKMMPGDKNIICLADIMFKKRTEEELLSMYRFYDGKLAMEVAA